MIAAESGYEREIATALQAGEIPVRMHPLSIKRALANMVVNAARYGNGWIKVSSGSEASRARFRVEDDGPGIKPEQREHLFQPFVRGDSARSTSGTGLGLAIVQRIIDNHNGRLEIGSSERGGLLIRAAAGAPDAGADETRRGELIAPAVSCSGCCTIKAGQARLFTFAPVSAAVLPPPARRPLAYRYTSQNSQ